MVVFLRFGHVWLAVGQLGRDKVDGKDELLIHREAIGSCRDGVILIWAGSVREGKWARSGKEDNVMANGDDQGHR